MSDDRKDLPTPGAPNFNERVRETLSTYLGKRGDPLDRGVTLRDLTDAGIVTLNPGYLTRPGGYVPIRGPAAGAGGAYEPDLTPPPTPTGVVVTATFSNLIIETDNQTYTQGHGHARTKVYGAIRAGADPMPVFANAVLITEFVGTVFAHPTTLGTEWHLWLTWVTVDGVESVVTAGGTNGYSATTGLVGGHDLGPLIVEAANLASGAVTATKIAATAVDLTKFANGIEPVTIVTSGALPTTLSTQFIFWTDLKLYRWNGSAYIKTVDGADIVANSITAGQIAAGAIGANEIAAGAITTGKLLVTGQGNAINSDPNTQDALAWVGGTFSVVVDTASPTGRALEITSIGQTTIEAARVPLDEERNYLLRIQAKQVSGSSTCYLGVEFTDAAGTVLNSAAGWSGGSYLYFGLVSTQPPGSYTPYQIAFGPGETAKIPTGAKYIRLLVLGNYSGTGVQRFAAFRLSEKADYDLIVDGAIIAGKIAANAIVAGDGVIQNAAITNALIANLAVDNAKIASLSAAKITFGTMSGDRIDVNTLNANRILTGTLTADMISTGTLNAGLIFAGSLSAATGTFSGSLSAASGSFTGSLSGASITGATGTFTGSLNVNSGGSNRMEITTSRIKIFDGGVERVRLGDLS